MKIEDYQLFKNLIKDFFEDNSKHQSLMVIKKKNINNQVSFYNPNQNQLVLDFFEEKINFNDHKELILSEILSDQKVVNNNLTAKGIENITCIFDKQNSNKVTFKGCKNLQIDLKLLKENTGNLEIYFKDCSDIIIKNGSLGSNTSILIQDSKKIKLKNINFKYCENVPIVSINNDLLIIEKISLTEVKKTGIYIGEGTKNFAVKECEFINCKGSSNWQAALVISARTNVKASPDLKGLFQEDNYWAKGLLLFDMLNAPSNGLIQENKIINSKSSGIYLDGAENIEIVDNKITHCSKEGMCLDYGCVSCLVKNNQFKLCGDRYSKTDYELEKDFVLHFGRDKRGSANAKLPAISIDNSSFCEVVENIITNNFGSGVKCVRVGYGNLIARNIISNNNLGQNNKFHFFGIELGNAVADIDVSDIDFKPSDNNIIAQNMIANNHLSGIFIDQKCTFNRFYDNVIINSKSFGIESINLNNENIFVNNYANTPTRNCQLTKMAPIYEGVGQPLFDSTN